jgi:hypothetical protein
MSEATPTWAEGSKKKSNLSFIHSSLDDYGLLPSQFRIYCHIARRGECYSSAPNIARHCRMNRDTVWAALKFLSGKKLIHGEPRQGRPTLYTVTPVSTWNPAENEGYKVTPISFPSEVSPNKGGSSPPMFAGERNREIKDLKAEISKLRFDETEKVDALFARLGDEWNRPVARYKKKSWRNRKSVWKLILWVAQATRLSIRAT